MVGLGCEPSTDDEDTVECRYHISSSGNILVMVDELKVIWRYTKGSKSTSCFSALAERLTRVSIIISDGKTGLAARVVDQTRCDDSHSL
jgi:hypothetical protein